MNMFQRVCFRQKNLGIRCATTTGKNESSAFVIMSDSVLSNKITNDLKSSEKLSETIKAFIVGQKVLANKIDEKERKHLFHTALQNMCGAYKLKVIASALKLAPSFDHIEEKRKIASVLLPSVSIKAQLDFLKNLPDQDPRRNALKHIDDVPQDKLNTTSSTIEALDIYLQHHNLSTELVYKISASLNKTLRPTFRFNCSEELEEFIVEVAKFSPTAQDSQEEREVYWKILACFKKHLSILKLDEEQEQVADAAYRE